MGTWNAVYFRGELPGQYRPAVAGRCPVRKVAEWTEVALPAVDDAVASCVELSRLTAEPVIWILLQTTASVLVVGHYVGGETVRFLESGDGSWRTVKGQPQPWEAWLFSNAELEAARDVSAPEDEATIASIFAQKTLQVGNHWPSPNEWDAFFAAIGVPREAWLAAQRSPPLVVLQGKNWSKLTAVARLSLAATLASVGALVARPSRDLAALAVVFGLTAALAGYLRRAMQGAWFL